jgi:hypothetical protein
MIENAYFPADQTSVEGWTKSGSNVVGDYMRDFHAKAIDAELNGLLSLGISKDRIAIENYPDMRTVVTVDGSPVSEFRLGYMENHMSREHPMALKKATDD